MNEPPNAEQVDVVIKQRINAAEVSGAVAESQRVEWRGGFKNLPVITMPQSMLRLNPETQRIKAQLDSDPVKEQLLGDEPYGAVAQSYLEQLLKGDPSNPVAEDARYRALVDSLLADGQEDPGIVTKSGRLIDGNTRCAALRELGVDNMRVAVLPDEASLEDIELIEIAFSVRSVIRREYSFINRILAVESKTESGWSDEKLRKQFRIRQGTLESYRWILIRIRDARSRSESEGRDGSNVSLRWVDFEQHQESLKEIARAYLKSDSSVDEADSMAEQRLLALVGFQKAKTDLRLMGAEFFKTFAPGLLPQGLASGSTAVDVPGIDRPVAGPSHDVEALKALTTEILRARAVVNNSDRATTAQLQAASDRLVSVGDELSTALDKAGKDATYRNRKFAPAERISDAADRIRLALPAIAEAQAANSFVAEELDEPLRDLRDALVELGTNKSVQAVSMDGADGFDWLGAVTSLGYES